MLERWRRLRLRGFEQVRHDVVHARAAGGTYACDHDAARAHFDEEREQRRDAWWIDAGDDDARRLGRDTLFRARAVSSTPSPLRREIDAAALPSERAFRSMGLCVTLAGWPRTVVSMTNFIALPIRVGAALLLVTGAPCFGQVLIDIGSLDYQGVLGPPILLGGRQCGAASPVFLSLSGGTQGNLYEVYEYDLAAQKEGAFVGSFPVAPNDDGLTLGSVAFSAPDAS